MWNNWLLSYLPRTTYLLLLLHFEYFVLGNPDKDTKHPRDPSTARLIFHASIYLNLIVCVCVCGYVTVCVYLISVCVWQFAYVCVCVYDNMYECVWVCDSLRFVCVCVSGDFIVHMCETFSVLLCQKHTLIVSSLPANEKYIKGFNANF